MPLGSFSQIQTALMTESAAIERERRTPSEVPADHGADRKAQHRRHRPSEKDESDGAPTLLRRHQQADASGRLRREDRRRNDRQHADQQQTAEVRHQRRHEVTGAIPEHRAGQQDPAVPACDHGGEQRRAEAHHDRRRR